MTISVLLVDDQMLVREGIKSLLNLSDFIQVVAEANDGSEVLEQLLLHKIDIILLDMSMPKVNGIQTLKLLQENNIAIPAIILTTFDDHQLVLEGLTNGAKGYLLKDVSLDTLCNSIQTVFDGHTLVQPAITERLVTGVKNQSSDLSSTNASFIYQDNQVELSKKEMEVVRLMACGYSNKEISEALFKSEGTIKNHVSNILSKFGVRDRTRAVLAAIEIGILK